MSKLMPALFGLTFGLVIPCAIMAALVGLGLTT